MTTQVSKKIIKNQNVEIIIGKKIITVNKNNDEVEAVAIQDGKIIGIGVLNTLTKLLKSKGIKYTLNRDFKNAYIYPGFIEPHMHPQMLGLYLINFLYIGFFDRKVGKNKILKGLKSLDEIKKVMKTYINENQDKFKENQWINFWGFDPLLHDNKVLTKNMLDEISKTNPICVLHQSGHIMSLNTTALKLAGYIDLPKDSSLWNSVNLQKINDELTGVVSEPEGMGLAIQAGAMHFVSNLNSFVEATKLVSKIAHEHGVTTIADKGLGFPSLDAELSYKGYLESYKNNWLTTRVHLDVWFGSISSYGGWNHLEEMIKDNNEYLWIGGQKIILDGSIQGFTANLIPGEVYVSKKDTNGKLQLNNSQLTFFISEAEKHNIASHIHANGNGAIEAVIDAIEYLHPNKSNKFNHSIEHNQLVTNHQLARMHNNNILSDFFINHIYYWGDAHAKYTVGPNLVHEMNPTNLALINKVPFAFHSDDPVTPVDPLFSLWVAVNRKSYTNIVYGEEEIILIEEALKAITINAAKILNKEEYIGSIELNKYADFTILEEKISESNKNTIKDIKIVATILGGKIHLIK